MPPQSAPGDTGHGMHLGRELARGEVAVRTRRSDTRATPISILGGQRTIAAENTTLILRVEAAEEQSLHRIQDTLARNLECFSGRKRLSVTWNRADQHVDAPAESTPCRTALVRAVSRRGSTIALVGDNVPHQSGDGCRGEGADTRPRPLQL